jgi:hypothetical protein
MMDADYLERQEAAERMADSTERSFRRQCAKFGIVHTDVDRALANLNEANAIRPAKAVGKRKSHVGGNCGASGRMASVTPYGGKGLW